MLLQHHSALARSVKRTKRLSWTDRVLSQNPWVCTDNDHCTCGGQYDDIEEAMEALHIVVSLLERIFESYEKAITGSSASVTELPSENPEARRAVVFDVVLYYLIALR